MQAVKDKKSASCVWYTSNSGALPIELLSSIPQNSPPTIDLGTDMISEPPEVVSRPRKISIIAWRVVNGIMFVFLACCAGVQFNDPDPGLWVPLYGVPSLLFLAISIAPILQAKLPWRITTGLELIYCIAMLIYTILYITDETKSTPHGSNPLNYEEGREMAGIGLVFSWCILTLLYNPNVISKKETLSRCKATVLIGSITMVALIPCLLWMICYVSVLADHVKFCSLMCGDKHSEL